MEDQTKPPYPLGDLTPEEIERLRQSKKEIAQRVKELWEKDQEKTLLTALTGHVLNAMKASAKEDFTLKTTEKHLHKNLDYMKDEGWIESWEKENENNKQ
jgi:predicted transcriptional regulator